MRGRAAAAVLVLLACGVAAAAIHGGGATSSPGAPLPEPSTPPTLALGPETGAPRLVVFTDYECPACAALERAVGERLRAWAGEGRLRLELRHHPLRAHRRARRAAAWTACASTVGRGWEMHAALLASAAWRGPAPSAPAFRALADSVGLDPATIEACAEGPDAARSLAGDLALGRAAGVRAVPSAYLDRRALGPVAPRTLLARVERALR